jgi:hypothetical protein
MGDVLSRIAMRASVDASAHDVPAYIDDGRS